MTLVQPRTFARGGRTGGLTIASLWAGLVELDEIDEALVWPPDVFALVHRILDASEAYRFVVSPPAGVDLRGTDARGFPAAVAIEWWEWLDGIRSEAPESLTGWWKVVRDAVDVGIAALSAGEEWSVTEGLLALHAIADEACAGLGSALAVTPGPGCRFRAAARELFAETGSLSRMPPDVLRVLPRCRVSLAGISIHSLARHVCVRGPKVDVEWHRMLSRPVNVAYPDTHANMLLLPWPLRVRARDFRPVAYELARLDPTQFGFFEFQPAETLDLALVEGVLRAAIDEVGAVDIVALPEAAITPEEIAPLETLLGQYGAWCLVAGVREPGAEGGLGHSSVHVGLRQEIVWRHARQHKHHRWSLDRDQINQYHLAGALSPTRRWWEAMSIPRRSLLVIDQGVVTFVPLVCEDLARFEPVADLVRAVGPSLVMTLLLDGPQLSSRWTARYASVLADDPGSAVCALTSYGMVRRCRPPGCVPSSVVALWKDASGRLTEIAMEEGAAAVLITTHLTFGDSITADGRRHRGTTSNIALAAVQSLHVDGRGPERASRVSGRGDAVAGRELPPLDDREVSKAASWAEAIAEAAVVDAASVERVLTAATAPGWRTALGLRPPTHLFEAAIDALVREVPHPPTLDDLRAAAGRLRRSDNPAAVVTGTMLEIALEQRLLAEVVAGRLEADVF